MDPMGYDTGWWCNVPILKIDGVRQWEGLSDPIYEMENKKCSKPATSDRDVHFTKPPLLTRDIFWYVTFPYFWRLPDV